MPTTNVTVGLELETCPNCSIPFAIPERFMNGRREDGNRFYCPNGHGMSYGPSEVEKLQKKLVTTQRYLDNAQERANIATESEHRANKRAEASEKEVKRWQKRATAGVCQFCHRTFQQVSRHMARQHPQKVI